MSGTYKGYFLCPECRVFSTFQEMGTYRAYCNNCKSVVKNEELKEVSVYLGADEYQCCECGVFAEFVAMGRKRVQCKNCDAIIMNEELVVRRKETEE